jgi:hypothetical protein
MRPWPQKPAPGAKIFALIWIREYFQTKMTAAGFDFIPLDVVPAPSG